MTTVVSTIACMLIGVPPTVTPENILLARAGVARFASTRCLYSSAFAFGTSISEWMMTLPDVIVVVTKELLTCAFRATSSLME